ncbi:hypothetical protein PybrP1_010366 [[Pythium] brassicae (nom. inval.)]|nr:hypothetical protein PybrP1_010366 [[Pythium] brassicae (nom. inval.)]
MNETTSDAAAAAAAAKATATQALLQYLSDRFDVLQVFLLSGYGIMFGLCVMLICYLRRNRNVALRGDAEAARKLILPAFEPLLWILGATTGTYTVFFCVALATNYYTTDITKLATEVFYSGRQFVFVVVVVYMFQKSVSIPALQRTVVISLLLSTYTIPIVWYMVTFGDPADLYWVLTTSRALLLLLYTYVLIYPPSRATPRTMREYCLFAFIYYALLFTYNDLFRQGKTDLGFSITIPRTQIEPATSLRKEKPTRPTGAAKVQRAESTGFLELSSIVVVPPSPLSLAPLSPKEPAMPLKMTVKGTVDYMAPEVINGRAGLASYGEAADVYSLAITMWDILNPGKSKYAVTGSNHFAVFELVLDGHRPVLDPRLHAGLREVVEGAWQADPQMRPSAQNVVTILETIQEEVAAVLALQVHDELSDARRQDEYDQLIAHEDDPADGSNAALFSGDAIVKHLERQGVVTHSANSGEAVRMGNAFMDAGLLHHARHAQPFEKADDALYFFDDDAIQFCHPIAFLEPLEGEELEVVAPAPAKPGTTGTASQRTAKISIGSSSQDTASKFNPSQSRSDRTSSQSMRHFAENGVCLCRKFGQRLELAARAKAPRRHRHHPFHRKFRRWQLAREKHENLLTAKLLRRDNDGLEDELSGFETVAELESTEELA